MNLLKLAAYSISTGLLLTACSSAPEPEQQSQAVDPYPDWFYKPEVENGLAAASCVEIHSRNVSLAQKQATANGRANLAFLIETKVKAMDKTYDRVANTNVGSSSGGTFESVSKQVTEQSLSGTKAAKMLKVMDQEKPMMCALVTMEPNTVNSLFNHLIKKADINLSSDHEAVLREQFMAYKAQQELEAELAK